MPRSTSDPVTTGRALLGVGSLLILLVGVLLLVLRIAQQNYMMALGVVWVANGLTMILHALSWWRYGLSRRWKVAVVLQGLLTIAPLLLGEYGLVLIFFMLGGAIRFW
ncbi:hypothetical protein [Cupriavidus basilensis]|uniref:hypothetical protein n=1 Tax=Cupriavidus basilensis TaxID=68895 RepID=UPI00157B903C|nr:hypothetical protein [Cupriavidus basilensis]NUA30519.1 hypothetical protein [Cupriavidus basilensis]